MIKSVGFGRDTVFSNATSTLVFFQFIVLYYHVLI